MTHALKTPIASIKALSETLCDGVDPDPDLQRQYCGMILTEANRQSRMVEDILRLSQLQSATDPLPRERVRAGALFAPVWEKYSLLMDCAGIRLEVSDRVDALPDLETAPAYVAQLMEILLDNALKFVPEGGTVWVEAEVSGRRAVIRVRDNGVGIAPKDLPHVFERFYKSSHDFNQQGSGLGLAIAREICGRLGEKIWVESQPGQGACFSFTLRLWQK
ncbi:MAG: HAMP domain-containing histidine kinase [Oscillospiraceae bacterium]|nr:HAMP domain-containing histidine kinase [Oscillospiraceae bacterium]